MWLAHAGGRPKSSAEGSASSVSILLRRPLVSESRLGIRPGASHAEAGEVGEWLDEIRTRASFPRSLPDVCRARRLVQRSFGRWGVCSRLGLGVRGFRAESSVVVAQQGSPVEILEQVPRGIRSGALQAPARPMSFYPALGGRPGRKCWASCRRLSNLKEVRFGRPTTYHPKRLATWSARVSGSIEGK